MFVYHFDISFRSHYFRFESLLNPAHSSPSPVSPEVSIVIQEKPLTHYPCTFYKEHRNKKCDLCKKTYLSCKLFLLNVLICSRKNEI